MNVFKLTAVLRGKLYTESIKDGWELDKLGRVCEVLSLLL